MTRTDMVRAQDMNGHSGNDEIGTPDELFAWLDRRFLFDFDAFASHENARTAQYATRDGVWCRGNLDDVWGGLHGLTVPWTRRRVFWNPPYSRPLFRQCIEKAIAERNNVEISVGLVKYDPSTENGRLLRDNFHLEYLPRIRYKGMPTAATFASVLAINRPDFMGKERHVGTDV